MPLVKPETPPRTREPTMIREEGSKDAPPRTRSPCHVMLASEYILQVMAVNGHESGGWLPPRGQASVTECSGTMQTFIRLF